ncbi:MAG: AmmeMemoRadiSam system protein B [Spirochaetales bacterium]|nr:AmmeMemoRadiSam system protein B [Spirochaetales bacterium]
MSFIHYKRLIYLAASLLIAASCSKPTRIETVYPNDLRMWNNITNRATPLEIQEQPAGAIIPHHTITAIQVAQFYKGLSSQIAPEVIFIISPNHFETRKDSIVTGKNLEYNTVYGKLTTEDSIIDKLLSEKLATRHDKSFEIEHGIFFHATFIKKFFPEAKIVPILTFWQNNKEDNQKIADFLIKTSTEKTFIIASVDFSHYQPRAVADFHDLTSYHTIKNFDYNNLYNMEIDSPSSVYTLLKVMEQKGYKQAKRYMQTNSDDFLNIQEKMTTSHQYFAFHRGEVESSNSISLVISGKISRKNDNLFTKKEWIWDREYDPKEDKTIEHFLMNLRSAEDRFFTGAHLYIFDLEEHIQVKTHNINGITVKIAKLNKIPSRDKLASLMKEMDNSISTILYEFDSKEELPDVEKFAKSLIDSGIKIVAIRGLGETYAQSYKQGVILCLEEFITEGTNSSGAVAGINIADNKITSFLFPIKIKEGYPEYDFNK